MEKDSEIIRTSLRLPKKLYDKLDAAAADRGMTMHAEILARLEQSFDPIIGDIRSEKDMMDQIAKVVEKVVRKVREEDRKAGMSDLPYDRGREEAEEE